MAIITPAGAGGSSSGAGSEVGYDQITAPVSVVSNTEATGTTVISCAAHTFDGSPVFAVFFAPFVSSDATAGHQLIVSLFEGATQIGRLLNYVAPTSTANNTQAITGMLRFTPSAASHTYTVTAFMVTAGSGTVGAGTSGTGNNVPAFIRFTKV